MLEVGNNQPTTTVLARSTTCSLLFYHKKTKFFVFFHFSIFPHHQPVACENGTSPRTLLLSLLMRTYISRLSSAGFLSEIKLCCGRSHLLRGSLNSANFVWCVQHDQQTYSNSLLHHISRARKHALGVSLCCWYGKHAAG